MSGRIAIRSFAWGCAGAWFFMAAEAAWAKHCPGGDSADCVNAAETARNPLTPAAGAVLGTVAGTRRPPRGGRLGGGGRVGSSGAGVGGAAASGGASVGGGPGGARGDVVAVIDRTPGAPWPTCPNDLAFGILRGNHPDNITYPPDPLINMNNEQANADANSALALFRQVDGTLRPGMLAYFQSQYPPSLYPGLAAVLNAKAVFINSQDQLGNPIPPEAFGIDPNRTYIQVNPPSFNPRADPWPRNIMGAGW